MVALVVIVVAWFVIDPDRGRAADARRRASAPHAARFAGISVERILLRVALVSGAIAGIAGVSEVAGIQHQLTAGISSGFGYTGIVVAMLGGLTMPGVLLAGLLPGRPASSAPTRPARDAGHPVADGGRLQGVLLLVTVGLLAVRRWRVAASERPPTRASRSRTTLMRRGAGAGMNCLFDLLAATLRTPRRWSTAPSARPIAERAGILNLGIEGTMYAGAFSGFAARAT